MEGTKMEFEVGDKIIYGGQPGKIIAAGPSPYWYFIRYEGQKCRYLVWGGALIHRKATY